MTTITLENKLIDKLIEKWNKENPFETKLTKTAIITKICINYLNNKKSE